MTSHLRVVAIAAIALMGLSACQPAANNTASTTTTTTTTEATNTTAPTGEATSTSSTTTTAATSNLPATCTAYFDAVQRCVDHLSAGQPAVAAQFRQQMDAARASYAAVTDQAALATTCTAAQNAFSQSSRAMGCS